MKMQCGTSCRALRSSSAAHLHVPPHHGHLLPCLIASFCRPAQGMQRRAVLNFELQLGILPGFVCFHLKSAICGLATNLRCSYTAFANQKHG